MKVSTVYEFDSTEHYRATREVAAQSSLRWFSWAFVAFAAFMVLRTWRAAPPGTSVTDVLVQALPWVVIGVVWLVLIPLLQRRAARRLQATDASVQGPQERWVDEAGYHANGNGVRIDVPWHALERVVESPRFFLFYYTKHYAYYIPKRALDSGEIVELRDLIRVGAGGRGRVLTG